MKPRPAPALASRSFVTWPRSMEDRSRWTRRPKVASGPSYDCRHEHNAETATTADRALFRWEALVMKALSSTRKSSSTRCRSGASSDAPVVGGWSNASRLRSVS